MELEFQKSVCSYLGSALCEIRNLEQTQEIKLSDGMPDIGRVLTSWGQVILRSKEWRGDSVAFSGGVMLWILYAPEDGTDPRCVESWIPFQMDWDIRDTGREGEICVQPLLRFVDARSVSARKLMVRAGVAAQCEALVPMEAQISSPEEMEADIQLLKTVYPVRLQKEAGEKAFLIDEDLTVPAAFPMPEKVICYTVQPEITEQKVTGNRGVFKGNTNLHLLYRAEDGQLHSCDFDLPFSQLANLEQSYDGDAQLTVIPCVTSLELDLDDEGHVRLKCGLLGQYAASQRQMLELVEDAYSTSREVQPNRAELELPVVLENRQENIYGEQTIPKDARTIVDVGFLPDFPKLRRNGDFVEMELPGQFQVLYYGEDGFLQSSGARWEGSIRMPVDESAVMHVRVVPKGRAQAVPGSGQISLRSEAVLDMQTRSSQGIPIITGLEVGQPQPSDPGRPSLILRRVGDRGLWQIAKTTGSTMEAIREANGLQGEPSQNQLLLIPIK